MPAALLLAFGLGAAGQALGWLAPAAHLGLNPHSIASAWQQSKLSTLYLDVKFQDAQRLKMQQRQAVLTGVHIAEPNDAVEANVRVGDETIPVQLSLPAGLVEQGNVDWWAFDLRTPDERRVLGWRHLRLSPLSLSQWGLGESLRRAGILAAPVQLVQVELNGDGLGVYGAWPAPGEELLVRQGRTAGRVVGLDPRLYWQDVQRQRGYGPTPLAVNLLDCRAAQIVADAAEAEAGDTAVALLRDLQNGRPASEVVDVESLGTLLALSTLWQGAPLDDWTRLSFYLNPAADRLEPIAPADLIARRGDGALRWPACFDDPLIQLAYVRALEKISRPDYVQQLRTDWGSAFEEAQLILGAAKGQTELTWEELAARQARLARWLEPTQAVLATWTVPGPVAPGAMVHIRLASLTRVPVQVLGLDVGKSTFLPLEPAWIQAGSSGLAPTTTGEVVLRAAGEGRWQALELAVPYDKIFSARRAVDEPVEMRIVTRLWGLTGQQSTLVQMDGGQ